jgi:hypothetical protein
MDDRHTNEEGQRIAGVEPGEAQGELARIFAAQAERWGAALNSARVQARRPAMYRGVRGMWAAVDAAEHISGALAALVSRRVALIVGCHF